MCWGVVGGLWGVVLVLVYVDCFFYVVLVLVLCGIFLIGFDDV